MDGQLAPLRRERAELLARSERLRLWARLVRARTDLLVAQLCPPTGEDDGAGDGLDDLAALVLDAGAADGGHPYDRTEHLLALREARRALRRREDELADRLCWSTARLVLDGTGSGEASPGGVAQRGGHARVLTIPRPRGAGGVSTGPTPTAPGSTTTTAEGWHTPA